MATKSNKKSKFGLWSWYLKQSSIKQALLFALAFGSIGGAILYKSQAASIVHTYYWNTGNGGKGWHHTGNHYVMPTPGFIAATEELVDTHVWGVNSTQTNGGAMWFGPYVDIPGHNHTLKVCWWYYAGTTKDATVLFDVAYRKSDGTLGFIYNVHRNTKTIYHQPLDAAGLYILSPHANQPFCISRKLDGRNLYNNVEIRTQPIKVGENSYSGKNPLNNDFRIWKTTWQLF